RAGDTDRAVDVEGVARSPRTAALGLDLRPGGRDRVRRFRAAKRSGGAGVPDDEHERGQRGGGEVAGSDHRGAISTWPKGVPSTRASAGARIREAASASR